MGAPQRAPAPDELARISHHRKGDREASSPARNEAQPEADPPLAKMGLCLAVARKLNFWSERLRKGKGQTEDPTWP